MIIQFQTIEDNGKNIKPYREDRVGQRLTPLALTYIDFLRYINTIGRYRTQINLKITKQDNTKE